jgi:hypothetical protein
LFVTILLPENHSLFLSGKLPQSLGRILKKPTAILIHTALFLTHSLIFAGNDNFLTALQSSLNLDRLKNLAGNEDAKYHSTAVEVCSWLESRPAERHPAADAELQSWDADALRELEQQLRHFAQQNGFALLNLSLPFRTYFSLRLAPSIFFSVCLSLHWLYRLLDAVDAVSLPVILAVISQQLEKNTVRFRPQDAHHELVNTVAHIVQLHPSPTPFAIASRILAQLLVSHKELTVPFLTSSFFVDTLLYLSQNPDFACIEVLQLLHRICVLGIVHREEFATHNPFPPLLDLIKARPTTVAKEWVWLLLSLLDMLLASSPPSELTFSAQGLFAVPDAVTTLRTCCEMQPKSRDACLLCLSLLISDAPDHPLHTALFRDALAVKAYPAPFENDGFIRFRVAALLAQHPGLSIAALLHFYCHHFLLFLPCLSLSLFTTLHCLFSSNSHAPAR